MKDLQRLAATGFALLCAAGAIVGIYVARTNEAARTAERARIAATAASEATRVVPAPTPPVEPTRPTPVEPPPTPVVPTPTPVVPTPTPPVEPTPTPPVPTPVDPRPARPDAAAPKPGDVLIDAWYGRYNGAQKTGWAHIVGTKTEDGYEVTESYESRSGSALTQVVKTNRMTFRAVMDNEFVVQSARIDSDESGERTSRVTVTLEGSTYTFATELDGRTTKRTCAVDAPVIGSNDLAMQRWFATKKLVTGFTAPLRELDIDGARVHARELRCRVNDQGEAVCSFDQNTVTLGADGVVRLLEAGAYRMVLEGEAQARDLPVDPPTFSDKLEVDLGLPHPRAFDRSTIEIEVEGYKGEPIFPENEYQRVVTDPKRPGVFQIEMLARPVPDVAFPDLGFDTKGMEAYLRPDAIRQCDAPEILAKAKAIIGDEKNSLRVVQKLARWIHVYLEKKYTAVGDLTALATLTGMAGDCSEHAILFDSFARSLGIPTREYSGYVFFDQQGGYHAWSQVRLGTTWVHVDCVVGLAGAGPQYIAFWQQNETGEYDQTFTTRRSALTAHEVRCRFVDVTLGSKTTRRAELGSWATRRGRWHIDELMGVAVDLPTGWSVTPSQPGHLALRSTSGDAIQMQCIGIHPLAILTQQRASDVATLERNPTRKVGGVPAWKLPGWGQRWAVEHPGGCLYVILGFGADAKGLAILDRIRLDLRALSAELDAIEKK